jgi:hypothetical protein
MGHKTGKFRMGNVMMRLGTETELLEKSREGELCQCDYQQRNELKIWHICTTEYPTIKNEVMSFSGE